MSSDHDLTVVVGAGASAEIGLPVGSRLRTQIAGLVNARFDHQRMVEGDRATWAAIRSSLGAEETQEALTALNKKAWAVAAAMPQASSIDTFIDSHRDDPQVATIGKVAIVRSILSAERESSIFVDRQRSPDGGGTKPIIEATSDLWYAGFFNWLAEGCTLIELMDRLSRTTCIVFNYDRCLQHFLRHAIANYYNVSVQEAVHVASRLHVLHPYGSLGPLDSADGGSAVSFGEELPPSRLLDASSRILTFSEQITAENSVLASARQRVAASRGLLFLGFGYHAQNLELLFGDGASSAPARKVFGTTYGISKADTDAIRDQLARLGGTSPGHVLLGNFECRQLFHEYSRTLAGLRAR